MFGLIGKSIILPVLNFCGGQKFWKELKFYRFLCTLCQRFSHFGRKRSGSALDFALYLTRKKFWKIKFLEQNFVQFFSDFEQKSSRPSSCFFRKAIHTVQFLLLEQYVSGQNCLKDKSFKFLSEIWATSFGTLDGIVEAVHSELHFTYPDGNFGGFRLSGTIILYFYLVFWRKNFVNWVKKFNSLLKTALYLCRSLSSSFSIDVMWFFKILEVERNIFGLIGKTFETLFYQSRNLLERKMFFDKLIVLSSFLCTLGKRLSHNGRKLLQQCSRISIVRVQPMFRMKIFSGKNIFPFFLLLWAANWQILN